ncbi:MAG: branched chain amino acid aminotransferase [Rhodospirillaceae bacterium]|nr:branched chain amino acid aminotransferase [Rhodospirillaceae bacterium]
MLALTFFEGRWLDGNPPVMGPLSQSFMHGSTVFDGARVFDGVAPDLLRHCERLVNSAAVMGLTCPVTAEEVAVLTHEGVGRMPAGMPLYVRPALFAEGGFLVPEPGTTRFTLTLFECPMPEPTGFSVCFSRFRRPRPDSAPTAAKASCLYPTTSHALVEAREKGFDNVIMRDGDDTVVEFGTSNLWIAKDGAVSTPAPNGTFLNGITRQRVMALLRDDGVEVREAALSVDDVLGADEVFSTGNLGKVLPVTRVEDRHLQPGPVFQRARALYMDFAHS